MAAATIDVANAVKTTVTSLATTHAAALPTVGLADGDMMVVILQVGTHTKTVTATSWTVIEGGSPSGGSRQVMAYRELDSGSWTPGGSQTFTYSGGSDTARSQAFTVNGADMADFTNSDNVGGVLQSSTDPMVLSANTLSSMATDSLFLLAWGDESAARAITTLDSDLTLIGSESDFQHIAYEDVESAAGNSAISTDMASARDWDVGYWEIKAGAAAAASGGFPLVGGVGLVGVADS